MDRILAQGRAQAPEAGSRASRVPEEGQGGNGNAKADIELIRRRLAEAERQYLKGQHTHGQETGSNHGDPE
jgi:hypothetical protein